MTWIMHNKGVFFGIIFLVVGGIWFGLSQSATPAVSPLTVANTSTGSPSQSSADQELVATLLTLRSVTLSGTIFQDPAFTTLRDFGTTIVAEPVGRPNPFAPLGNGGQAAGAQTTQQGTTGGRR